MNDYWEKRIIDYVKTNEDQLSCLKEQNDIFIYETNRIIPICKQMNAIHDYSSGNFLQL